MILPVGAESITRNIKVLFSFHLRSDLPSILEAAGSCQEMFPFSKKHKHMNKETHEKEKVQKHANTHIRKINKETHENDKVQKQANTQMNEETHENTHIRKMSKESKCTR